MRQKVIFAVVLGVIFSTLILTPVLISVSFGLGLSVPKSAGYTSERDEVAYLKEKIDSFVKLSKAPTTNQDLASNKTVSPMDRIDYYLLYDKDGKLKTEISTYLTTKSSSDSINPNDLIELLKSGKITIPAPNTAESATVNPSADYAPPPVTAESTTNQSNLPPETPVEMTEIFGTDTTTLGDTIDLNEGE